jgi:hypothetical protein
VLVESDQASLGSNVLNKPRLDDRDYSEVGQGSTLFSSGYPDVLDSQPCVRIFTSPRPTVRLNDTFYRGVANGMDCYPPASVDRVVNGRGTIFD